MNGRGEAMFTGLVSAIGAVEAVERRNGLLRLAIRAPYPAGDVPLGASICHAGCCLTVVEIAPAATGVRYTVELAPESLEKTTLGQLSIGDPVNLERSLKLGDELGGHLVTGHVDGRGRVLSVTPDGEAWRLRIAPPAHIARLIATKGSVAVDGVSLTVNEANDDSFGVMIIPHTWSVTTLSRLQPGDEVNLEADLMARYAARILGV